MPAGERKPASDRGRPALDWEQAFAFYAGLRPTERAYRAVADHFHVSVRTVEKHGLRERWKERVQRIEAQARAQAEARLAEQRLAKLAEVEKLIDATHLTYAEGLRRGSVRVVPADLPRLHKLRRELWDDQASAHPPPSPAPERERQPATAEHKLAVLRALHEADALHELIEPAEPHDEAAAPEGAT